MKVTCIVCSGPGHLDFGGFGFVKLAQQLSATGHRVEWITTSSQAARLRHATWRCHVFPTDGLDLQPFRSINDIANHDNEYRLKLSSIIGIEKLLRATTPDLIIVDRILALAAMIAEDLEIPWVSIGKPAGWWVGTPRGDVQPSETINQAYVAVGDRIRRGLGRPGSAVTSLWANSPHLNISFLGQDFYAGTDKSGFPSAYVNHFDDIEAAESRQHIGVSFGNTGKPEPLIEAVRCLADFASINNQLDVFVGNRVALRSELQSFEKNDFIRIHGWVDFGAHFQHLKCLVFPGGNGTVWQCVNHLVPMLIVPSVIGDQHFNGTAVARLGLGRVKEPAALCSNDYFQIVQQLDTGLFRQNLTHFRRRENYTHSLESVTGLLETIATH